MNELPPEKAVLLQSDNEFHEQNRSLSLFLSRTVTIENETTR